MKDHFLATEFDNDGMNVEVYRCEHLGMSPIYTFFLKHYAELIDAGHAYPTTAWDDKRCGAVYAVQEGNIIGHIVYDRDNPNASGALWITLSAVEKAARGKGIYKLLHKYFEQTAKELGYWAIASHVHADNTVRLKSADSVGMKPVFHLIGKRIT